jgi:hypothetical protein
MKLNKIWKIIIGLTSLWVVAYPFLMVVSMFAFIPLFIMMEESPPSAELPVAFSGFKIMMILMVLSSFLQMALSAFYLAHVVMNKKGTTILLVILGIGVFYLPYIAMPTYYFVYILPETPPEWALQKKEISEITA